MAKVTLDPIGNFTSGTVTTINTNMDRIEAALENTLSRDGTIPNQMTSDLDMNNQDILNVQMMSVDTLNVDNLVYEEIDFETIVSEMTVLKNETVTNAANAEAAADAAIDAASSVLFVEFPTVAAAQAYTPLLAPNFIRTAFFDTNQALMSGALYKNVGASEPTHAGKLPITQQDLTVVWYEIAEDTLSPTMIGVLPNVASDQSALFQSFVDVPIDNWYIPSGIFRLDTTVTRTGRNTIIRGPGTLDFSNGNGQLILTGSATQISDLASNVALRAQSLTFLAGHTLASGDLFCIFNPTDYSWSGHRYVYREGEFCRVHSVVGDVVQIYGQTYDPYAAAAVDIYKIDGIRVDIDEITLIASASSSLAPIQVDYGDGVVFGRIKASGGISTLVQAKRCFNVTVGGTTTQNASPVVNDEYGVSIANCQNFTVSSPGMQATRHPIHLGGFDDVNCVPVREGKIYGAILDNSYTTGAGDAHGNCDHISYIGCTVRNQFVCGGRNMSWIGNTVWGDKSTSGICMFGSEIVGGVYTIKDNLFISDGNGLSFAYVNITSLGPSNTPTGLEGLRNDLTVVMKNNTFDVPGASNPILFQYDHRGNAAQVNVVIDGVTCHRTTGTVRVARIRDSVTTPLNSTKIIVDNVDAPTGSTLLIAEASNAGIPRREMVQRGSVNVSCVSAATQATAVSQSFRYIYSKIPTAQVSFGSTSGGAQSTWGGKGLSPMVHAVTTSTIRPAARTSTETAFTSTEDVKLCWQVGITEV